MQVTIVKSDGFVSVDGVGHSGIDLSWMPGDVLAVQWSNNSGEVERALTDGSMRPGSIYVQYITSLAEYQPALDAWAAAEEAEVDVTDAAVLRSGLRAALAAHRYAVETAGVEAWPGTYPGSIVATDRENQSRLMMAFFGNMHGLVPDMPLRLADGWLNVGAVDLENAARAVMTHVRRASRVEAAVWEEIGSTPDVDLPTFDMLAAWDMEWASQGM